MSAELESTADCRLLSPPLSPSLSLAPCAQIVINLGGKKDMLGVGVFDGHSGPEASKYVAANLWGLVRRYTTLLQRVRLRNVTGTVL